MKNIFTTTAIVCTLFIVMGCSKFLDIYPEDKFVEQQVIVSEEAINSALNGIYMGMASNNTYGAYLSMTVIECLAQRYDLSHTNHAYYNLGRYAYEEADVRRGFTNIWESLYTQILRTNVFMDILDKAQVPIRHKDILLGEAYVLRAFFHFDLLRLFGPIYSVSPNAVCMPYQDAADGQLKPMLPANEVVQRILEDLDMAATLLQNDPVRTTGRNPYRDSVDHITNFYTNRHYRMNYFAVKAMQARVHLWTGHKEEALKAAKEVIDAKGWFPWTELSDLTGLNRDRVFSKEVIFGINNYDLYANNFDRLFSANLPETSILCPRDRRLQETFEGRGDDFRFAHLWIFGSTGFQTFFKYDRPGNISTAPFAYFQPIIRISEMYYIAAECEPNPEAGLAHLNTVRNARNITGELTNAALLQDEIRKEYMKEFYGEGQLFYYYKRTNRPTIPNGNTDAGTRTMTADQYRLPLPLDEQRVR